MRLTPGDIVFTRNTRLISKLIRWVTRAKGEPRSWASHVALVSRAGELYGSPTGLPYVIEALVGPGVVEQVWSASGRYAVARALLLPPEEKIDIVRVAREYVGDKYTERALLFHFLGLARLLAPFVGRRWRICSWVVGIAYKKLGYTFGKKHEAALDPDDIFDFVSAECDKHDGKYAWIIPPQEDL